MRPERRIPRSARIRLGWERVSSKDPLPTLMSAFPFKSARWKTPGVDRADKGIFLGVKPSGVVVCAWYRNAKNSKDFKGYVKTLRQYALAV